MGVLMNLPLRQVSDSSASQLFTQWKSLLDPVIGAYRNFVTAFNPFSVTTGELLTGVSLSMGATVISHHLNRTLSGWVITDIDGAATVYRSAPFSSVSLTLTSSAAVTASVWVF
jgi:hypothetical protein